MKKKLSQTEILTHHLLENRGQWFPSWSLMKVSTLKGYLGTAAPRRIREEAEIEKKCLARFGKKTPPRGVIVDCGIITVEGIKCSLEYRLMDNAEYRVTKAEKQVTQAEVVEDSEGRPMAQIRQLQITI